MLESDIEIIAIENGVQSASLPGQSEGASLDLIGTEPGHRPTRRRRAIREPHLHATLQYREGRHVEERPCLQEKPDTLALLPPPNHPHHQERTEGKVPSRGREDVQLE